MAEKAKTRKADGAAATRPRAAASRRTREMADGADSSAALLRELVAHLRQNRTQLREEWARRITEAQLLTAMSREEIFAEATSVYDNYVAVLETGSVEALQDYARNLSERIIPRGVETHEVRRHRAAAARRARPLAVREVPGATSQLLNRVLDAYEPAANRIANTVGVRLRRRSASASSASSRRRSASCPRRCSRCASGC